MYSFVFLDEEVLTSGEVVDIVPTTPETTDSQPPITDVNSSTSPPALSDTEPELPGEQHSTQVGSEITEQEDEPELQAVATAVDLPGTFNSDHIERGRFSTTVNMMYHFIYITLFNMWIFFLVDIFSLCYLYIHSFCSE